MLKIILGHCDKMSTIGVQSPLHGDHRSATQRVLSQRAVFDRAGSMVCRLNTSAKPPVYEVSCKEGKQSQNGESGIRRPGIRKDPA